MGVSTLFNYDVQGLTQDLAKVMRIQDWDIFVRLISGADMVAEGHTIDTEGLCTRDLPHHDALIQLNHEYKDMVEEYDRETCTGWMYTLVHELYHIVLEPYDTQVDMVHEFLGDEKVTDILDNNTRRTKETVINHLTKVFFNVISEDQLKMLLDKHKKKAAGTDFEAELEELMKKYEIKGGVNIAEAKTTE